MPTPSQAVDLLVDIAASQSPHLQLEATNQLSSMLSPAASLTHLEAVAAHCWRRSSNDKANARPSVATPLPPPRATYVSTGEAPTVPARPAAHSVLQAVIRVAPAGAVLPQLLSELDAGGVMHGERAALIDGLGDAAK